MTDLSIPKIAKELLLSRYYKAVFRNVVVQLLLLCIFLIIVKASVLKPLVWFGDVFRCFFAVATWIRLLPVVIIIVINGIVYTQDFSANQFQCTTRFSIFLSLFSVRNVMIWSFHQISGGILVFIYLSFLTDNFQLSKACTDESGSCIIERNLFYILNGFWIGFLLSLYDAIHTSDIFIFPPVHLGDSSRIHVWLILIRSLKYAIMPSILFSLWYYFWGYTARDFAMTYLNLLIEDSELNNFSSLFLSSLPLNTILLSTFFLATMFSIKHVFKVIMMQEIKFSIESNGYSIALHEALVRGPYILRSLGARDFYEMALNDQNRRNQVFSLSQPGGNPRNWKNLLQPCLLVIGKYNEELELVVDGFRSNENTDIKMSFNAKPISHLHMKNVTSPPVMLRSDNRRLPLETIERSVKDAVINEFNKFICFLYKKPLIYYFFGEIAEYRLKSILSEAQYIIWISQGLSHLAAASFYEDQYGIVQNDLSVIITLLVQLKQNIDKINKSGLLPKKNINHDDSLYQMKLMLRSAIKRCIYVITVTFKDFLKDIPLSPEINQALQLFVTFREE